MAPIVRFDGFEVDLQSRRISRRGATMRLRDQPLTVLLTLLERPGQVVTREELRRRLWPDEVYVDFDNILNTAVARLREALGDSADRPRFIETLPRHGYRFIAPVHEAVPPDGALTRRPRLMVLPFLNTSGDPAQEPRRDRESRPRTSRRIRCTGRADEALDVLAQLRAAAGRQVYVPPTSFAWTYLGLGDVDNTFDWLGRAVEASDRMMVPIQVYWFFDPLRDDPRFMELLRRMKLTPTDRVAAPPAS